MGGVEAMSGRVIAGIGCRRNCSTDDILSVVGRASAETGMLVNVLAAPVFKAGEAALQEAARQLGVPLILIDAVALSSAQERCVTRSLRAEQAIGVASVAEGCALAAAGIGGRLLLVRIAGHTATCALAEGPAA
jgi:cobalt-precorrin 5A hydrolase